MKTKFKEISDFILSQLKPNEIIILSFSGESSLFIRVNKSKIRQIGNVIDGDISIELIINNRTTTHSTSFSQNNENNKINVLNELNNMREYINSLPVDPYIVLPNNGKSSSEIIKGEIPNENEITENFLSPLNTVDCSGIWASGKIYRGSSNSSGQFHWFETENYSFDFSLITSDNKMVKETYSGNKWNFDHYKSYINESIHKLKKLNRPEISINPGNYRTYIAPAGVSDLLSMFSWGGLSESAIQQGASSFCKMRDENLQLNPKFNLREDFNLGLIERFNSCGEVTSKKIDLIANGLLKTTLISSRSALEYNLISNQAEFSEQIRSPIMGTGDVEYNNLLNEIYNGIYLSNLHYLNWSNQQNGRITGMTRYACYLIEKGEIIAPISQMRFDDSFYHFFGPNLDKISSKSEIIPNVNTYGKRNLGGTKCPGIIIDDFTLTL